LLEHHRQVCHGHEHESPLGHKLEPSTQPSKHS
jgi:hypothetical protein